MSRSVPAYHRVMEDIYTKARYVLPKFAVLLLTRHLAHLPAGPWWAQPLPRSKSVNSNEFIYDQFQQLGNQFAYGCKYFKSFHFLVIDMLQNSSTSIAIFPCSVSLINHTCSVLPLFCPPLHSLPGAGVRVLVICLLFTVYLTLLDRFP